MSYRVDLEKHFYHPRSHQRITQAKARTYQRRTGKRIKPRLVLTVRRALGPRDTYLSDDAYQLAKRRRGQLVYQAALTRQEAILRLRSVQDRAIRNTLARHRVFHRLYEDFEVPGDMNRRGAIRVTLNGTMEGRRIREVIHLGFRRDLWNMRFANEARAREGFKNWLTASILSNLRRRGLRVSDPIESHKRVQRLTKDRADLLTDLDRAVFMEDAQEQARIQKRITWHTKAIQDQKASRQLRGVTIRVEKLI